jgi:O-antigen ligase
MFIGIGLQNYSTKLVDDYRISNNVPHNSIQELIIAWGIPGVILFIALIICMNALSRRYCKKHNLANYIPLLILLFKGMAGQMLTSSYTILAFSLAYISMCQNFNRTETSKKYERKRKKIRIRIFN